MSFLIDAFYPVLALATIGACVAMYIIKKRGRDDQGGWPLRTRIALGSVFVLYAGAMFLLLELRFDHLERGAQPPGTPVLGP